MKTIKLFKPNADLMKQLYDLTKDNAGQWYKEYLKYHNGEDHGVLYVIGYFTPEKANMLRKIFTNSIK